MRDRLEAEKGARQKKKIEIQNKSMSVRGWIRVLREEPQALGPMVICAVRADVWPDLTEMRIGWDLNAEGTCKGKHHGNCFQDPTLFCPKMAGDKFRTTLTQDGDSWFVLELCEPISTLIDCSAEFFGYVGDRFIITIITASEKPSAGYGPHNVGRWRGTYCHGPSCRAW